MIIFRKLTFLLLLSGLTALAGPPTIIANTQKFGDVPVKGMVTMIDLGADKCNPGFESVYCVAHLDQNIELVLPYLNAVLGGFEYLSKFKFDV